MTMTATMERSTATTVWRGLPGSRGTAEGTIATVSTLDAACNAHEGQVLLLDRLPASWVPLLPAPAAVVVGKGGALCNAAIVLRERHIPAVFGLDLTQDAPHDGDRVTVDGTLGTMTRGVDPQ
jgi:pyruvate,water dikinase